MVINVLFADNGQGAASNDDDDRIWRPRFRSDLELADGDDGSLPNDSRIVESFRTLRCLLNKLSAANFCKIVVQFESLLIENENPVFLDQTAAFLVDKAITEPLFSRWYVEMLCSVSDGLKDEIEFSIPYRIRLSFEKKLISTFNDLKNRESGEGNREIAVIEDAELREQLNETEFRFRRNFVGVGRVLAESFNLGILSLDALNECIETLLSSPKETSLMCLCKLMTTIGKTFEFYLDDAEIDEYFLKIQNITENLPLSTKSRFMLLNLLQYKENFWVSKTISRNLLVVEQLLRTLSKLYDTKNVSNSATISDSDFLIEANEAFHINNIFNKFTQCPRNLAAAINLFSALAVEEKTKLVRFFIMCVTKGDIYSEDCGRLFACLVQSRNVTIPDIILGVKTVIRGYRKQQQIWTRLKEIFQTLFVADVFTLSDLEDDEDIQKARELEVQNEKQSKKKPKSGYRDGSTLSWRRGLPVMKKDKGTLKKQNEADSPEEAEETDHKKDEDES